MGDYKFDKGLTIDEILKKLNESSKNMECFKRLGCLTEEFREPYRLAYTYFKNVNSQKNLNGVTKDDDNRIKGKALEDLVALLFEGTGGYYEVYKNLRNGSNEIDLFLKYSDKGLCLSSLLKDRYGKLLCECKNYDGPITVTYVGKFFSLMQTTQNNIGVMFSFNGFSGKSWGGAKGLSKKLFMLRERIEDKVFILEFTNKDFQDVLKGKSIFAVLDDKYFELQLGIDEITKYITKHPNE